MPNRSTALSTTPFNSRLPFQITWKLPKPRPPQAVVPKTIPTAPSRDIIHYIPPSNPLRSELGPGMYYNAKVSPSRRSSTPLDKDVETEFLYTLMLRKTFGTPIVPAKVVALKYAIKRCMDATGSHKKAVSTRLRKGFLSEAVGTLLTKKKTWVCDHNRAASFDWDLHENMRFIHGHMFTGREVDYSTPEGQVYGAEAWQKKNVEEEERGKRFRRAMEILQGDDAATATPTSKIADMEVASGYNSDGSDSDGKIRDDWVLEDSGSDTDFEELMTGEEDGVSSSEDSGSDTDFETLMAGEEDGVSSTRRGTVSEDSGSDTDFEALATAGDVEEEGEDKDKEGRDEDEDEDEMGKDGKRRRRSDDFFR